MIKAVNITKYFGSAKILDGISFEIGKNEIVGFLGQNGAGKTTLMRILTSFLAPTSGQVFISGEDVTKNPFTIGRQIGYLPENPPLYPSLTVRDYLKFAAQLKDVNKNKIPSQIDRVLEECHLRDVRNKVIGILSKGYKQRLGIAQAIIHDPQVLILDEPTNGLDPVQILHVRELIRNLGEKRTIIVSTHILSEIEELAKRVMILKNGKLAVDQPLGDILSQHKSLEGIFLKIVSTQLD